MACHVKRPERPDLHIHTTASDGTLSPAEVCRLAAAQGVDCVAITDHDTLEGIRQLKQMPSLLSLPAVMAGVELSCGEEGRIHILGYGVRLDSAAFNARLELLAQERKLRAEEMVRRLEKLQAPISRESLGRLPAKALGRAHIARLLKEAGHVASIPEAFARYLNPGCPAFVPKARLQVRDALALIRESGGVGVLAHPGLLPTEDAALVPLILKWREAGLQGLEAYHSANGDPRRWVSLARRLDLIVTGGSDFHGFGDHHGQIGQMLLKWRTSREDLGRLLDSGMDLFGGLWNENHS